MKSRFDYGPIISFPQSAHHDERKFECRNTNRLTCEIKVKSFVKRLQISLPQILAALAAPVRPGVQVQLRRNNF
jgi:hypothetical protein